MFDSNYSFVLCLTYKDPFIFLKRSIHFAFMSMCVMYHHESQLMNKESKQKYMNKGDVTKVDFLYEEKHKIQ